MAALALPDPPLTDGTVALRAIRSGDVPALVAHCQDPEIQRWSRMPNPYGEDQARAYLRRTIDGRVTGTRTSFAIVDAGGDDQLIGAVGLNVIDWRQRAADIGYWLAAAARGRGMATRAVELLVGWAFGPLGLERLELRAEFANHASRAVAERAGFAPVTAPVVRRPECDHLPDVFFARLRGA